jgi:hypothetical protein
MTELEMVFDNFPPAKIKSSLVLYWFLKIYTLISANIPIEIADILYMKSMIG